MNERFDAATRAALDSFVVPPLRRDFADRMVARALAPSALAPLPAVTTIRRTARGGWRRGRTIVAGLAAFSLMSAAAATTGVFGEDVRQSVRAAPVIRTIIASVSPEPPKPVRKPKVQLAKAREKPVVPPPVALSVSPDMEAVEPLDTLPRERLAQRLADRITQREARGLAPLPPRYAPIMRKLRRLPLAERQALLRQVRDLRAGQASESGANLAPPQHLSPEVRAAPRAKIRAARLARQEAQGAIDANPPPDAVQTPERTELRRALREWRQERRTWNRQHQQQPDPPN